MRMFLYLRSNIAKISMIKLESVRLNCALAEENPALVENGKYAEQHLELIRRFGRFPRRNTALGRQPTQEEVNFLKEQKRE